jgi:hypothetical protein
MFAKLRPNVANKGVTTLQKISKKQINTDKTNNADPREAALPNRRRASQ